LQLVVFPHLSLCSLTHSQAHAHCLCFPHANLTLRSTDGNVYGSKVDGNMSSTLCFLIYKDAI